MHRFYLPGGMPAEGPVRFPRDIARQLSRVLRMRTSEEIGVFDGSGTEWTIELDDVSSRFVEGHVVDVTRPSTEPRVDITLYQSLIDAAQFELVLQKGVELGVKRFVPLLTERVSGSGAIGASEGRQARWARIVQEAVEQSGRVFVPEVIAPVAMDAAFADPPTGLFIVPWEGETSTSLRQVLKTQDAGSHDVISIVIGPKGGLTEVEIEFLKQCGALPVTLGSRILRAETAAIATVAMVLYEVGDLEAS
jgi:16S rRNA (uracil1498-N3)-methyltransferase